jgi:hypothetical protein
MKFINADSSEELISFLQRKRPFGFAYVVYGNARADA